LLVFITQGYHDAQSTECGNRYLGGSSPLCALTSELISGYVRQTQHYLLEL